MLLALADGVPVTGGERAQDPLPKPRAGPSVDLSHGDLAVSPNKRFLVHKDGTPFLYLGDTAWELFHRLNREEADQYLENRRQKGFTVIQAVALAELDGLGTPNAHGHLPLADRELRGADRTGPAIAAPDGERLRLIVETDAGGDPDDEQSLVRFLLYANEWDVEGIIANRPVAREKENLNPERTGLGIVQAQLTAYGRCYANLVRHDQRFPPLERLWQRTVAGYDDCPDGVKLLIAAADSPHPRPIWFCNWGADGGSATSGLKRALDQVLRERGHEGYAKFKGRFRLSSYDKFGEHAASLAPPWTVWVDTFHPEVGRKRWYRQFSALTATAGGFDLRRDVLIGHGPLMPSNARCTSRPTPAGRPSTSSSR